MPLSKIKTNSLAANAVTTAKVADEVFEIGSNFIINGAMQIAQRSVSAVAAGAGTYPSIDRFKAWEATSGAYTVEQSTTAPAGFSTSLKAQVTTAATSLSGGHYAQLSQQIEAQNLQSLVYGTNDAKTITLSFYVRSNKTGSYGITIYKADSTSYLFSKSYTIDSADTWERKSITIAPDSNIKASGGAIANDNGLGFYVFWNLAQGGAYTIATDNTWSSNTSHYSDTSQVNWMDSTSNNFYLTGVQLEIGNSATPFQHEDIGTTLTKCQRYHTQFNPTGNYTNYGQGTVISSTSCEIQMNLPTEMRDEPGFTSSTPVGDFRIYEAGTRTVTSFSAQGFSNRKCGSITVNCSGGGMTTGRSCKLQDDDNKPNNFIAWTAEL